MIPTFQFYALAELWLAYHLIISILEGIFVDERDSVYNFVSIGMIFAKGCLFDFVDKYNIASMTTFTFKRVIICISD